MKNSFLFIFFILFISCSSNGPKENEREHQIATINFDFGSSLIPKEERYKLNEIVSNLDSTTNSYQVVVKGYTDKRSEQDSIPKLGLERAINIKNKLVDKGIPQKKIQTISYEEKNLKPTLSRRAVIEIVSLDKKDPNPISTVTISR